MADKALLIIIAAVIAVSAAAALRRFRRGSSCCGDIAEKEKKIIPADTDRSHYPYSVVLKVEGMTCANCKTKVENALNSLDGVWANADLGRGEAKVLLKSPPDTRALCSAVAKAGYSAAAAACRR